MVNEGPFSCTIPSPPYTNKQEHTVNRLIFNQCLHQRLKNVNTHFQRLFKGEHLCNFKLAFVITMTVCKTDQGAFANLLQGNAKEKNAAA